MGDKSKQQADGTKQKNIVHEQSILVETIKKELRDQKLYEEFSINPFVKCEIMARKPNTYPEFEETSEIDRKLFN
jgi:hypothetical protein